MREAMSIETRPFDAADYIDTAADQADLLSDADIAMMEANGMEPDS